MWEKKKSKKKTANTTRGNPNPLSKDLQRTSGGNEKGENGIIKGQGTKKKKEEKLQAHLAGKPRTRTDKTTRGQKRQGQKKVSEEKGKAKAAPPWAKSERKQSCQGEGKEKDKKCSKADWFVCGKKKKTCP